LSDCTVRHIVETLGGGLKAGTLKGVIIGGPLAGIVPPNLLDGISGTTGGAVPGGQPTPSGAPTSTPVIPFVTGTFTSSIPEGTAVVRANGLAGTWTISAEANGHVDAVLVPGQDGEARVRTQVQVSPPPDGELHPDDLASKAVIRELGFHGN
jgi:hypothetical protein